METHAQQLIPLLGGALPLLGSDVALDGKLAIQAELVPLANVLLTALNLVFDDRVAPNHIVSLGDYTLLQFHEMHRLVDFVVARSQAFVLFDDVRVVIAEACAHT